MAATASNELAEHVWPANSRRGADGAVTVAGIPATDLVAEFGSPLFVIDEDDFRARCRRMAAAFGPDASVHYASKAFLSVQVARWVHEEGLNLDVASGGELAVALHAGFPAAQIALHGNNKSVPELIRAVTAGVGQVVLDSLAEIERLERVAAEAGVVQDVLIRVTPGVQAHTHEFISTAHEDQKFGFSLAPTNSAGAAPDGDSAAMTAADAALAAPHLRLVGLHSHIGSQIFEADGFEVAARRVLATLRQIADRHGPAVARQLRTVDLGGGMGIAYLPQESPSAIEDLAAKLREIVATEAAALDLPTPHLAVEPGRAIAGPPGITLYTVGTIKDVALDSDSSAPMRRYVSVDGGMSDNIRPALYGAQYTMTVASRAADDTHQVPSRIVGKHCESGDIVIRDIGTPADLRIGDVIAVAATGAYCYSMSSRYNMLPRPAVVAALDGAARLILRRETVEDLLSLEVAP